MSNEKKPDFFETSQDLIGKYLNDRLLLFKIQATSKASKLVALLISVCLITMLGFFILLFLSIMAGYYFAELTGSLFYGFGIITLVYIGLLILLLVLRKSFLQAGIANIIVRIIFNDKKDDDDNNTNGNPSDVGAGAN